LIGTLARAFVGGALVMGAVVFDIIGTGRMRAQTAPMSELTLDLASRRRDRNRNSRCGVGLFSVGARQ
jgi:hypothetical protein